MESPSPARLVVALVTPCTPDHRVDAASLERLVRALWDAGIREFFVAGSTGESPLLDDDDRRTAVAAVRAAAPAARIHAGISGAGHRAAIRLAREVREAGADVGVLMAPHFIRLTQDQLAAYAEAVAEAGALPVALYHHLRMPTPFEVGTVARLSRHPNVIALKDTSGGDRNRCAEILAAADPRLEFLQGVESLVLATLRAGGHGCVVAQGNIAPRLYRELFDAWTSGRTRDAEAAQARITALWDLFSREDVRQSFAHFLHSLKRPLQDRGWIAHTARAAPGPEMDAAYDAMLRAFFRSHPDAAGVEPAHGG